MINNEEKSDTTINSSILDPNIILDEKEMDRMLEQNDEVLNAYTIFFCMYIYVYMYITINRQILKCLY
jgi:hypothetical protein